MKYVRVYADDEGESHFADIEIPLALVEFAPPAPPSLPVHSGAAVGVPRFACGVVR
jgi:hypothetical protein